MGYPWEIKPFAILNFNRLQWETNTIEPRLIFGQEFIVRIVGILRLVFTSDGAVVGVVIRRVERYDLVKIKPKESEAEH